MAVIAVANQKGVVGKTTTTINLAAYMAKQGARTLLVDLDPQANSTSGLGIDNRSVEVSIGDALFDPSQIGPARVETEHYGLQLVPAGRTLANAEVDLVQELGREYRLQKALEQTDYDYVFIDCPPALGLLTVNALSAADYVLVPVQAEYYALEGLSQLMETISRIRAALNPGLEMLGIVITMYDSRTQLSKQVEDEIQRYFPGKLFNTTIPRNVRLAEAPSFGRPISEHDKWSKGAKAYKALAKEVKTKMEG